MKERETKKEIQTGKDLLATSKNYCEKVIEALKLSSTPYHFVNWASGRLNEYGFIQIKEKDSWDLQPGKSYYLTRNLSSVIAFSVGAKVDLKNTSFAIVGGHTDSPTLRFAPNAYLVDNTYEKFNLQTYGGGQWQTWFDRDLSLGGKIVIYNTDTKKLETRLIRIEEPILFIPNLCIHLQSNTVGNFNWNNETNLKAILSTTFFDNSQPSDLTPLDKKIGRKLADLISSKLNVSKENIYDYNLMLYDSVDPQFIGIQNEFISSERLDNQGTSITGILSIIEALAGITNSSIISVVTLFDSEEIGSMTFQGANSSFLKDILTRIFTSISAGVTFDTRQFQNYFQAACSRSLLLSSDMAHLYHPNYPEFFQNEHKPLPHHGPVLKTNSQGKYSTEAEGASLVQFIAAQVKIPLQDFIVRQDLPSGTTIGPILAGKCGIRSVDIGCPQLAMHSIKEQTSVVDICYLGNLFTAYFNNYADSVGNLYFQSG